MNETESISFDERPQEIRRIAEEETRERRDAVKERERELAESARESEVEDAATRRAEGREPRDPTHQIDLLA